MPDKETTTGVSNAKPRPTQISAQVRELNGAIEALSDTITQLQERLEPILRDTLAETGVGPPQQELVPLARDIQSCTNHVGLQRDRLDAILNRIEL